MPFAAWTWPEFVNTVVQSLAVLGTFIAVLVALHIANRDRKIVLLPSVTLATRYDFDKEVIRIMVTNVQRRKAKITRLYWKAGAFKRKKFSISITELITGSSSLDAELTDGEQVYYDLAIRDQEGKSVYGGQTTTFQESMFPKFKQFYPHVSRGILCGLWLRLMKIGVETTTGKTFEQPIEITLRRWLSEQLRSS